MAENVEEEVERYRRILEDWKPGPGPRKNTPPPAPARSNGDARPANNGGAAVASAYTPHGAVSTFTPGAILLLNGRTLAVYRKPVPEKEYHLVLVLCPNQTVKAQGIALEGYQVEELGSLAPAWFERLQNEMRWERDLIVFHCYRYEDVAHIPAPERFEDPRGSMPPVAQPAAYQPAQPTYQPAAQQPVFQQAACQQPAGYQPVPPEPERANGNGQLRRGQRLQIQFGAKAWDAVYWGKDDQGQVIAHRTYENWSLMHLDLERFANGLVVTPEIDMVLVKEIEHALMHA